jgi:pimeloyl-ACP methyl ester carboxylesterase
MGSARRPAVWLLALVAFTACSSEPGVRSDRAEPLGGSSPGSTSPTGSTEPGTSTPTGPATLVWGHCTDPKVEDNDLQCATLTVPLDYDHPNGDTIDLALVRVPASGDRQGAVLFNPGGPGGSGFDYVATGGTTISPALGLDSFDLIGFDPRGVDRSDGVHCVTDQFLDQHDYVDQSPDTPEEQTVKDEATSGFIDGCKQKYGDTLRFFSTANTARDMDAIRAALGDEQISFLGVSYGTYLGAVYATMFPDRVRGMVLDSVLEPNGDTVEQQFETQLVGFEGAFNNWAQWCQTTASCAFTASDVGARWDALKQQLDDSPLTATDGRVGNNTVMFVATQSALYSRSEWPVLGEALEKAENGDPSGIFALADSYNERDEKGVYTTLQQSFPVITCASGIEAQSPDDPAALLATLKAAAPRMAKDLTVTDLTSDHDRCQAITGIVDPVQIKYAGDGPILLIGGTNDPATPIRWAKKMVGELGPNARLTTYTGEGHGALLASKCVTDLEGQLLADLKLPAADKVCDPDPVIPKPDWWDSLPTPDQISPATDLPALAAAIGADPTQVYGDFHETSLNADDAVTAYEHALEGSDWQLFETPGTIPVKGVAERLFINNAGDALAVVAFPPQSFDDELKDARAEIPPDTTVVWLFQVPT